MNRGIVLKVENWKRAAAAEAAKLVKPGMVVGLGSGTTMAEVVKALAELKPKASFIPSSSAIQTLATRLGLELTSLDEHPALDLVLDGADEVDPSFNLLKGAGGAHTREKLLASAAKRFIIVVDRTKLVSRLGERSPVAVEVIPFAWRYTMLQLERLGGKPELRRVGSAPFVTDNGNYVVDVGFGPIENPAELELTLNRLPGVVENGIFTVKVEAVLVGHERGCSTLRSREEFLVFLNAWKD